MTKSLTIGFNAINIKIKDEDRPMKNSSLFMLFALLLSTTATAKLNGKNVVLVHGLQTTHLGQAPNDAGLQRDANKYWEKYFTL